MVGAQEPPPPAERERLPERGRRRRVGTRRQSPLSSSSFSAKRDVVVDSAVFYEFRCQSRRPDEPLLNQFSMYLVCRGKKVHWRWVHRPVHCLLLFPRGRFVSPACQREGAITISCSGIGSSSFSWALACSVCLQHR